MLLQGLYFLLVVDCIIVLDVLEGGYFEVFVVLLHLIDLVLQLLHLLLVLLLAFSQLRLCALDFVLQLQVFFVQSIYLGL